MKFFYYCLLLITTLFSYSCSRKDSRIENKDPRTFNQYLLQSDIKKASIEDLSKLMQKDPEAILFKNRIVRYTEIALNVNSELSRNRILKNPDFDSTTFKNNNTGVLNSQNKDILRNYCMLYVKYVKVKQVDERKFKSALQLVKSNKSIDYKSVAIRSGLIYRVGVDQNKLN